MSLGGVPARPKEGRAIAISQNGYLASPARERIHTVTVPGTNTRLPVRVGAAGDLLIWFAARWHREVEPLHDGWSWGWAYRPIRGGGALSNHSSGTAIDLNAPAHGLGTPARASFSAAQIAAIHRILADAQGCLRWGGDYSGRTDPMHTEVVKSEAECARVLAIVSGQATPPAPVSTSPFQEVDVQLPTLKEGDGTRGTPNGHLHWYVLSAQALLNVRGLPYQVVQDGVFGLSTVTMVKELQVRNKLTSDGICGPKTWAVLLGNDAPDYSVKP